MKDLRCQERSADDEDVPRLHLDRDVVILSPDIAHPVGYLTTPHVKPQERVTPRPPTRILLASLSAFPVNRFCPIAEIGGAAEVDRYADGRIFAALASFGDELRFLLVTSAASLHPFAQAPEHALPADPWVSR